MKATEHGGIKVVDTAISMPSPMVKVKDGIECFGIISTTIMLL